SNEFSERLRYILDRSSNVRFIEIEFRRYVKDLYYISILLSSKIHRKVTTRMLMSINEIYHDVDRLHIFKVVRNVLDYYIDREFVAKLIDKYLKVLYKKYSDKSIIRHELRKVWYIRRLFRL
ncbi:MAG: hypothetical protein GXO26_07730, partial [Crenarchaeota archaeon]|nr:hypothetical protein [Thermoproteota archaeon]